MNWLHYLVEANIYLGVFYLCYCLFLNNETHYTLSRIYLLFSCIISFILPVTQLSILKPIEPAIQRQVAYIPTNVLVYHSAPPPPPAEPVFTLQDGLIYVYILGVAIALTVFLSRLYQLFKLSRSNKRLKDSGYQIIHLKNDNTAFSFFNYLFIGTNISGSETIIAHELVHIRQKHSWDIMLLEVLKVVNWFNPFVYLLQRSIKTVHEYIADEQTAAYERDALTYSSFLLNNAYGIQGSTIAHSFFNYNLLKKRIIMLNKNRSGRLARLKYLTVLPLCAGMLCASTLAFAKDYGWVDLMPRKTSKTRAVTDTLSKYTLQMTGKEGTIMRADTMVFKDIKTGSPKTYSVNTLTQKDKVDMLKKRGIIIERVLKTDTIKPKLPPPPAPPTMKQSKVKLPPPPPAPAPKVALKTPPKVEVIHFQPPVVKPDVPAKPKSAPTVEASEVAKDAQTSAFRDPAKDPIIFVNGERYQLKDKVPADKKLYITAADSVTVYTSNDKVALKKWGDNAKNGVINVYGKPSFTIR